MAQDITFLSGYVNSATDRKEDTITMDITDMLRGMDSGSEIDYNYFNSQSNNTNFSNGTIYTTFNDSNVPTSDIYIPDFIRVKITGSDMVANYEPNHVYQLLWITLGTDSNNHTYGVFVEFWFTGKATYTLYTEIQHFNVRWGIRSGTAGYEQDYMNYDLGNLSIYNNATYNPFFCYGFGFLRITDPTVPEDRRVVFFGVPMLARPSVSEPFPNFPIKLGLRQSTTNVRTTCTPWYSGEISGSYAWQGVWSDVKFIDVPKLIGVLNLRPDLRYLDDFSPEVGPASEEEPYDDPSHDDSSDSVDVPAEPTIGVTDVGFVNVYKTGSNSLQNMGVELFPPLNYTPPTAITAQDTTDAIINGFNSLVTFFANIPSMFDQMMANTLINYVIDCHMIPVTPSANSSPENIKVGYKTLRTTGYKVTSDYKDVDCGSISLAEYYGGFADFLENVKLYLPFVGFVSARPEWFKRTSLQVKYRFNIIDGSFVAYVLSSGRYVNNNNSGKTIVGQYAGNACVHLPITGVTYSNMVAGLVGSGSGAIAAAGSGNMIAAATSAIVAAGAHGDIAQSNAYNASASFMGCRRPFLLIERPVSNYSKSYQKELGIPSNITKKLGNITGFTMVGDIHLDGIDATDQEKIEIEKLLRSGVIL